jgi:hypothetical protein
MLAKEHKRQPAGPSPGGRLSRREFLMTVEPGRNEEVIAAVRGVKGVTLAHLGWGQPDTLAFVEAANDRALGKTLLTAVQGIPRVRSTETHIVAPL